MKILADFQNCISVPLKEAMKTISSLKKDFDSLFKEKYTQEYSQAGCPEKCPPEKKNQKTAPRKYAPRRFQKNAPREVFVLVFCCCLHYLTVVHF